MTARQTALAVLMACEGQGAWADGELKKALRRGALDRRDAALCANICYGVLQNRILLDFYLAAYSKIKPEKMERRVLTALRMGAYQLLCLDKIPPSAAVNESVEAVRKKNPGAAGFVNGVLRTLQRERENLPKPQGDAVTRLSIQYSHPAWIVKEFYITLGEAETEALLRANNAHPPMTAQVNTCKTTAAALTDALRGAGVEVTPHPWQEDCLILSGTGDLEALEDFQAGLFYLQDPAARLAVEAAGIGRGMAVLDACAAPGGKSFAAALAAGGEVSITACDLHPHKNRLIEAGAARLGLDCIKAETQDAGEPRAAFRGQFDVVLADLPCSGLGVIRKKPDLRYKPPAPLAALPALQARLLDNLAHYVKPGGVLLYSTCTLLSRENGAVTEQFIKTHPTFITEPFETPVEAAPTGELTLYPHRHGTDGFYLAKLRRNP